MLQYHELNFELMIGDELNRVGPTGHQRKPASREAALPSPS